VDTSGDCPPLWRWNRHADDGAGRWELTQWGQKISDWLMGANITMVVLDTIASAAQGSDLLDQPQQYQLGQTIRRWSRDVGLQVCITVSHTNQASASVGLHDRLDYLSRAGGNGFPGALRHLGGLTKLRKHEVPGVQPETDRTLFAFGFSKHNESPQPDWTNHCPAVFSQRSGRVELVLDGREVAQLLAAREAEADAEPRGKQRGDTQGKGDVVLRMPQHGLRGNVYSAAKSGQSAHYLQGKYDDYDY
jgi:hypothetical protein